MSVDRLRCVLADRESVVEHEGEALVATEPNFEAGAKARRPFRIDERGRTGRVQDWDCRSRNGEGRVRLGDDPGVARGCCQVEAVDEQLLEEVARDRRGREPDAAQPRDLLGLGGGADREEVGEQRLDPIGEDTDVALWVGREVRTGQRRHRSPSQLRDRKRSGGQGVRVDFDHLADVARDVTRPPVPNHWPLVGTLADEPHEARCNGTDSRAGLRELARTWRHGNTIPETVPKNQTDSRSVTDHKFILYDSPVAVKPLRERQAEATRALLIDTARALFTEQGYSATSIDDIIRQAGVARGALYHHFPGKEALFRAVYDVVEGEVISRVVAAALAESSPWEGVTAGLRSFLDACLEPAFRRIVILDSVSVLQWQASEGGPEHMEMSMLRTVLAPLATTPELQGVPVEPLAYVALGGLYGAALYIARSPEPIAARAEADAVLDTLISGLRSRFDPTT